MIAAESLHSVESEQEKLTHMKHPGAAGEMQKETNKQ
jgi:hypothetical protein